MNKITIRHFPALGYAASEAVNTLCTNLSFAGEDVKKIMFTSSHASEGKTFLAMNVMRTLVKLGKSVALVDADLRKSILSAHYGLEYDGSDGESRRKRPGLSHLLAGMVEEEDVIYETDIENAYLVPVGRCVSNSLTLLSSPRFTALLDHLKQRVDYVLVDAPPVGMVIDAAQIAKSCDGSLIVVSYNQVHRRELLDIKTQLQQTGCPILGVALNNVQLDHYMSRKYYYKGYYSKYEYYGSDSSKDRKKKNRDRSPQGRGHREKKETKDGAEEYKK